MSNYSLEVIDQMPQNIVLDLIRTIDNTYDSFNEKWDRYSLMYLASNLNQLNNEDDILFNKESFKSYYLSDIDNGRKSRIQLIKEMIEDNEPKSRDIPEPYLTRMINTNTLNERQEYWILPNGRMHGEYIRYFNDEKMRKLRNSLNGSDYTNKMTYPHGQVAVIQHYNNGELNGEYIKYYENGNINLIENYINGMMDGTEKHYNPDGSIIYEGKYTNGKPNGEFIYYKNNGEIDFKIHRSNSG